METKVEATRVAEIEPEVWDCGDYVEYITGDFPCYKDLESMEKAFAEEGIELWNYPLEEISHAMENNEHLCLVRFTNEYGGYDYRWCEIK